MTTEVDAPQTLREALGFVVDYGLRLEAPKYDMARPGTAIFEEDAESLRSSLQREFKYAREDAVHLSVLLMFYNPKPAVDDEYARTHTQRIVLSVANHPCRLGVLDPVSRFALIAPGLRSAEACLLGESIRFRIE